MYPEISRDLSVTVMDTSPLHRNSNVRDEISKGPSCIPSAVQRVL